ncbi:MAG: DUF992 domain-containing protein [Amphiplicatus sp.]
MTGLTVFRSALLSTFAGASLLGASTSSAPAEELYENLDVLGAIECTVKRDIRTMVRSDRLLRCVFKAHGGLPDVEKRYFGSVRALDETSASVEGDVIAWTVLSLKDVDNAETPADPITGTYSPACNFLRTEYGLKENSLFGGVGRNIALEPRDAEDSAGSRNVAAAIIAFEISK